VPKSDPASQHITSSTSPTSASRGRWQQSCRRRCKSWIMAALPQPDRRRMKSARSCMQLSAQGVILAGARIAAHTRAKNTRQPGHASECREISVNRRGLSPAIKRRLVARNGSAYAFIVRSSGQPASASSSRFKACRTSKQPTRWAPRKTANVQSASTSRQCLPGAFQGVILSRRSRRLRRV
jgi:hypothetical protein